MLNFNKIFRVNMVKMTLSSFFSGQLDFMSKI